MQRTQLIIYIVSIVAILGVISIIPSVSAASGQCQRSIPSQDVKWFNDKGIDQPENWINQPSAMRFGDFTYVVWQAGNGFVPCIQRYDHVNNVWSNSVQLASSNPIAGDGHGAPTVFITPGGKILVTYGAHISALKYIRGDVNNFENGFVSMSDLPIATYPHFLFQGTNTWMFYRGGDACSSWRAIASINEGLTWGGPGDTIQVASYIGGITVGPDNAGIYFEFATLPNCGTDTVTRQNAYVVYYLPDNGNAWWCKNSTGDTQIGFTVTNPIPAICKIENAVVSNFGNVRKDGIGVQTGNVYTVYEVGDTVPTGNWQYHSAIWNGSSWNIKTISYMDHYQDYSDFRLGSFTDIDAYVLQNATDGSGNKEGGNLQKYHWDGTNWNLTLTILSQSDTGGNLLSAPFVPVNSTFEVYFDERIIGLTNAHSKLYVFDSIFGFYGVKGILINPNINDLITIITLSFIAFAFIVFAFYRGQPIALFVGGFAVMFLTLPLWSFTNSIAVSAFIIFLGILIILDAIAMTIRG